MDVIMGGRRQRQSEGKNTYLGRATENVGRNGTTREGW